MSSDVPATIIVVVSTAWNIWWAVWITSISSFIVIFILVTRRITVALWIILLNKNVISLAWWCIPLITYRVRLHWLAIVRSLLLRRVLIVALKCLLTGVRNNTNVWVIVSMSQVIYNLLTWRILRKLTVIRVWRVWVWTGTSSVCLLHRLLQSIVVGIVLVIAIMISNPPAITWNVSASVKLVGCILTW